MLFYDFYREAGDMKNGDYTFHVRQIHIKFNFRIRY